MNLTNKTIVITGGATGLGLALTEEFIQLNNSVIICGRREEKLAEAKNKFPMIHTFKCDVSKKTERENFIDWLFANHPETNVFINNAGIQNYMNLNSTLNMEKVSAEIETNITAIIHFTSLLVPHFKNKNATIINITSGLAFAPLAMVPVYCATKAAVHSFTLSSRHQLKRSGIGVIEIAPPIVDTALGGTGRNDNNVTHRGITPKEFAEQAVAGLLSGEKEICVGQAAHSRLKREEMFGVMNH